MAKKKTNKKAGKGSTKGSTSTKSKKVVGKSPVTPVKKKKKNIFSSLVKYPQHTSENDALYKKIFKGLCGFMLIAMILLSFKSGINSDDKMQNEYEQKLMAYYTSGGEDKSALDLPKTKMHFYGGMFEVITGVTNKMLGSSDINHPRYHKVRHFWNAIFGFFMMFFIAMTAKELAGWRAAIIALLFAFFSPRLLGHSVMNPKDIPFAMGYIMSLYYMIRMWRELPNPTWKTIIGMSFAIGIAVGVRAGGLLVVAIFGLFTAIDFLLKFGPIAIFKEFDKTLAYLKATLIPIVAGLILAIIFWPYAIANPIENIGKSLAELSKYGVNIRLLFDGGMVYAQALPWTYLPKWVLYTIPLFAIIGFPMFFALAFKTFKKYATVPLLALIFAAIFPFVWVILQDSTLYDGWRHLIFPYTAMLVLVALAWDTLIDMFKSNKAVTYGVLGLMTLTALDPAIFIVRNLSFPYTYFNPLIGGIGGAFGQFETDYWGTSIKQGVEYLEDQGILSMDMDETVVIATNFLYPLDRYLKKYKDHYGDAKKVKTVYVRYRQRYDQSWDYGLFNSRFVDGTRIQNGTWPTSHNVHSITANNTPLLSVLKDNKDRLTYRGVKELKAKNYDAAISLLTQEHNKHPDNEIATQNLANAYMNKNDLANALKYVEATYKIDPENIQAMNIHGLYLLNKGKKQEAYAKFKRLTEIQEKFPMGWYYMGVIDLDAGKVQSAFDMAKKSVTVNPKFKPGYELAAKVLDKQGKPQDAKKFRDAAAKIK